MLVPDNINLHVLHLSFSFMILMTNDAGHNQQKHAV